MPSHDSGEIRRHAVIGGLISLFLAGFHLFEADWLEFVSTSTSRAKIIAAAVILIAAFVLAFLAIWLVESVWKKVQWSRKIPVEGVGIIDGCWIQAIVEDHRISQGSVIILKSAAGEGFSVSGTSYEVDAQGTVARQPWGMFRGQRGTLFPQGISYVYDGQQGGNRHFGVVYYQFRTQTEGGKQQKYLEGAFLARQQKAVHLVVGRMLPEALSDQDVFTLLQEFVMRQSVQDFASSGVPPAVL